MTFAQVSEQKLSAVQTTFFLLTKHEREVNRRGLSASALVAMHASLAQPGHKKNAHDISARLTDLNKAGLIVTCGVTRDPISGKPVQLWRTTSGPVRKKLKALGIISENIYATNPKTIHAILPFYDDKRGREIMLEVAERWPDTKTYFDGFMREALFQYVKLNAVKQMRSLPANKRSAMIIAARAYAASHEGGHKLLPLDVRKFCVRLRRKYLGE